MTDIANRTGFITGGANGIGLGIARSLANAGAKLALVDLDSDALGPVSILVNNAGVAGGAAAARLNYDLWDWGMGINLGHQSQALQLSIANFRFGSLGCSDILGIHI